MSDRRLIYAAAFLRALATGTTGVLLAIYLTRVGLSLDEVGRVISAGLAGAATAAIVSTFRGDRLGRRRVLVSIALLGMLGTGAVALASESPVLLLACAFAGMLNGMGRDRGASLILEQAALPATASDAERTAVFARYNVVQDAGHAFGGLLAALPALLRRGAEVGEVASQRWTFGLVSGLLAGTAILSARLSSAVEPPPSDGTRERLSPATRRVLLRISSLFALDSLAGGLLTTALLSYYFFRRFGVDERAIGLLFFGARLLNAASHLAAARLARRIGLVNTMVFTHIPSNVLLATVAIAPSFPVAAILFLLREGLVEMDVPTRQSYVMAVVRPEERTIASGTTNLVRMAAWAVAAIFAGMLMQEAALALPLVLGASMKIAYDVLLWIAFRRVKPPEEERAASGRA